MVVLMGGSMVKNPPANAGDLGEESLIPGLERPWTRQWQPAPVFLPGKSHGWRSLRGYRGHKKLNMTEGEVTHTHMLMAEYDKND